MDSATDQSSFDDVRRLARLAVDRQRDRGISWMADVFCSMDHTDRCRCRKRLAELPGPALVACVELQVAARHVQADRIAVDMVERLGDIDVSPPAADRNHEFDLVMEVVRLRWVGDRYRLVLRRRLPEPAS